MKLLQMQFHLLTSIDGIILFIFVRSQDSVSVIFV
mgnify:CR=1 FL=1